jgi:transcriptional regulator
LASFLKKRRKPFAFDLALLVKHGARHGFHFAILYKNYHLKELPMYIPKFNQETDLAKLLEFMHANNFITLTSVLNGELMATHLPVSVWQDGEEVYCTGHFAKANPQWQAIHTQENLLIFSGAHAYISPTHYDKYESVPTWNYIAVHAYGTARILSEKAELEQMMARLVKQHEASYQAQWDSLSDKYKQGMLQGVVGFEMVFSRIEGKYKLSQNKTAEEQERIADSLAESPYSFERDTAHAMHENLKH